METALRLLGAFIVIDLFAALALVILVGVVYRRGGTERLPFGPFLGALLFLGLCSAFIYGGIWMVLHVV